jgi:energy-coupling factor transporter ATP-binding protein EcfA2
LAIALYGAVRVAMTLLVQAREGMFAKVAMNAVRRLALDTFEHMHALSLRFHLERKTGGLTQILSRGRAGIENITRMVLMTFVPTIVEFALVLAVCAYEFDWRYVVAVLAMIAVYLWFTVKATNWRIKIRRVMNESDTDAYTKAIDSLLNYETVKYFGAEEREARRYDGAMAVYERASVKTYTSLAVLNAGQAVIFTVALTACMVMSGLDVAAGRTSVGQFVMVNALLLQLFIPLNFMGMVYREIRQSLTDIERMMDVLGVNPEVADKPGARALVVSGGNIRFEDVAFSYEPERPILKGLTFEVPAGKAVAIVGPSGAGKSTVSRILLRFYDVAGGRVTIDGQDIRDVTQSSLHAAGRGAAGHRAVQRHHPLQHPLRPPGGETTRVRRPPHGPDRRLHPEAARGLPHGGRARPEAWRRQRVAIFSISEAPILHARRGHQRTRQPRKRSGRARPGLAQRHRRHRPPPPPSSTPTPSGARRRQPGRAGHARQLMARAALRQPVESQRQAERREVLAGREGSGSRAGGSMAVQPGSTQIRPLPAAQAGNDLADVTRRWRAGWYAVVPWAG